MITVIGCLGRAGSGKSTAAAYLRDKYGAYTHAFAAPLKDLTKELFEFSEGQMRGTQVMKEAIDPRYGISPRTALIRLGDGARRHIGDRVWIDVCLGQIRKLTAYSLHVIEDLRYNNEAKVISRLDGGDFDGHDAAGYVIKLVCPDSDSTAYANASSERSVDEVDPQYIYETVVSSKSPGSVDLKSKIDLVMQKILGVDVCFELEEKTK
jgi:hypothetical protein